jgi:uncharacterized protein with GYD domain
MSTFIMLVNWTDQGIKSVKDSPARLDGARAAARKFGCEITAFYMTMGVSDMVVIAEGPNDEAFAKFSLTMGSGGNIRTTTLKAFSEDTYRKIVTEF